MTWVMRSLNACQMRFLAEGASAMEDMIRFSNVAMEKEWIPSV